VQAVRSFFPKFDDLRPDPIAAPARRARWSRFLAERLAQLCDPFFEHGSTHDHLALVARDGATTGPWRPRPPVGVRLIVIDHLHRSGHPDLSVHRQEPMEEGSGNWIRPQLPALVAFPVGVEDETSVIDASEQHHSGGRAPTGRGCGNCHRLGHGLASCPRHLEPPGQLGHRIGIDGRFVHDHSLLARAAGQVAEGDRSEPSVESTEIALRKTPTVGRSTVWEIIRHSIGTERGVRATRRVADAWGPHADPKGLRSPGPRSSGPCGRTTAAWAEGRPLRALSSSIARRIWP
jgi:hypothetical protein